MGEVVRRLSGRSLGTFFQEEVAEPLDLDFWIGLPSSELERVTPLQPLVRDEPSDDEVSAPEDEAPSRSALQVALDNDGGYYSPGERNSPNALQAELGASGGLTNGRSLARLYVPLALDGSFDGIQFVSPETVLRMNAQQSALNAEVTDDLSVRFTLGYYKLAFGHGRRGGSMGFADTKEKLAFGDVMNQMNTTRRWLSLAKAAYQALGYHEGKFGLWIK